jgi:hypothetical protein
VTEKAKRAPRTYGEAFQRGQKDARIKGHGSAILRAIVVGTALAAAWFSPVQWYWKIVIFLAIMFVIGLIAAAIERTKETAD